MAERWCQALQATLPRPLSPAKNSQLQPHAPKANHQQYGHWPRQLFHVYNTAPETSTQFRLPQDLPMPADSFSDASINNLYPISLPEDYDTWLPFDNSDIELAMSLQGEAFLNPTENQSLT